MRDYNKNLKSFSRKLRKNQSSAELILWDCLRRKQILGIQFYRQKILGNYIVDFYAPSVNLVVELDGSQHYTPKHREADKKRDTYLESVGLHVLRFNNLEVFCALDIVVNAIERWVEGKPIDPSHGEYIELW